MPKIEWPMTYRTADGKGSKTLLAKIADMPTTEACNQAAALVLAASGYDSARIYPFRDAPPAPTFTHDELEAMWHSISPKDAAKWPSLGLAVAKLDAYIKRSRGEG